MKICLIIQADSQIKHFKIRTKLVVFIFPYLVKLYKHFLLSDIRAKWKVLFIRISGVGHTEDLGYIFDFGYNGSRTDYLVRERFVKLIVNFAKYRNPTPKEESVLQNLHWPANRGDDSSIKQLNITDKLEIITNPYNNNMVFWKNTFQKYGHPPFDTY